MTRKGLLNILIGKLLGTDKMSFSEIYVKREIIEDILNIAQESYPKEFVAMLQGKIADDILTIDGLIFLPGKTSDQGAVMQVFMKPLTTGAIGSVHSHPGFNAHPSRADRHFFSKNGIVHFIVAQPYDVDSLIAYNSFGEKIEYKII